MMLSFDDAFERTIGSEGGLSMDPNDPGNWTGGSPGKGELRGTKYGISAKAFPALPIASLSLDEAKRLAKIKYWNVFMCDQFPPAAAFHIFDTAYHGGYPIQWMQEIVGVEVDSRVGPKTIAAVRSADPAALVMQFNRKRLEYLTKLQNWPSNSRGWTMRIVRNMEIF